MTPESYLIIALLLGTFIAVSLVAFRLFVMKGPDIGQTVTTELSTLRQELQRLQTEHRQEMQSQLGRVNDQVYKGLSDSQRAMQTQFEQTSKFVADITQRLTTLDATNKQVLDFSSQLQNLQNILKNPKQRGVLGEYWLETLLRNVLPPEAYAMQYRMGHDDVSDKELIADAVIFIKDQIVPIDAKFSLENYNRIMEEQDPARREKLEKDLKADVKERIDETSKYIQPQKGTMDFAFMFIPAEGVYYNLMNAEVGNGINSKNLLEYAFSKHVMIVSPTSLFAYLQTVILGLKNLRLEKDTQEIIKRVADLGKHVNAYADCHDKLGKQLSTVVNHYNSSSNELRKMHKDTIKITSGSLDELIEIASIDKPMIE